MEGARESLVSHLNELDTLVSTPADHDTLHGMTADLPHSGRLRESGAKVRSAELATPQAANAAITVYKDTIRRLEKTAGALGGASDHRMRERAALLDADTSHTSTQMTVTALLAIAVAILMSFQLSRSVGAREGESAAE